MYVGKTDNGRGKGWYCFFPLMLEIVSDLLLRLLDKVSVLIRVDNIHWLVEFLQLVMLKVDLVDSKICRLDLK